MDTESDIELNEETRWIREHIKMRECNLFSRKKDQSNVADPECQCGHSSSEHRQQAKLVDKVYRWDKTKHTIQRPTNAFGEIKFVGFGEKTGKYIRVDAYSKEPHHIVELLTEKWKMKKPNLLISVTGGTKFFQMNERLKQDIRRGLVKAAQITGAWIITGRTHSGVMKLVGESVKEASYGSRNPVVTIGITPWGCIQNRDQLVNDEGKGRWPAIYRLEREQNNYESYLDPNHSHFILYDDGTQHQYGAEIEFRTKLDEELAKLKTENAVAVPTVMLVLDGGLKTLRTVYNTLKNNTQVVIVKDSGRVSNILAYAYTYAEEKQQQDSEGNKQKRMSESLEKKVRTMVKREFGDCDIDKHMKRIEGCLEKCGLMSIYEYNNRADVSADIDVTMLKALLKANQNQEMDQLHLALAWNRIDVAKSEIFTDDKRWSTGSLADVMTLAIQLHRVDFVKLFLDHGVCLKEFLTLERLLTLYNKISETSLLGRLLSEVGKKDSARKKYSLKDVGKLMQKLMGDDYKPNYRRNEDYEIEPANDLFILSVLSLQQDMAKLFWSEGKDAIAAALVGNGLLKAMVDKTDDAVLKNNIQKDAEEWSQLSIGVLNGCYYINEHMAKDLVVPCMAIAVKTHNKEFISQPKCQSQLHNIWMGKMWYKDQFWEPIRVFLCVFFPPLACILIKLDEDRNSEKTRQKTERREDVHDGKPDLMSQEKTDLRKKDSGLFNQPLQFNQDEECKAYPQAMQKLYYFFTAPVSICAYDTLSFITFLLLFSYILIVTFNPKLTVEETVLIVWVCTFIVEKIRQVHRYCLKN